MSLHRAPLITENHTFYLPVDCLGSGEPVHVFSHSANLLRKFYHLQVMEIKFYCLNQQLSIVQKAKVSKYYQKTTVLLLVQDKSSQHITWCNTRPYLYACKALQSDRSTSTSTDLSVITVNWQLKLLIFCLLFEPSSIYLFFSGI